MDYLFIYLIFINIFAFLIYGADKYKARHNQWRIPEKVLLLIAVIGGSVGAYIGMKLYHHKTRKAKFAIGVPVIFLVQVAAVIAFYYFR